MTINNDRELWTAVRQASTLIQDIHDYAGRDFTKRWRLRFPRGYVRTASEQRERLAFLDSGALKDNIAYTLMLHDTLHWLLVRTDITATLKEQLIKMSIFLAGGLCESMTKVFLQGRCGGNYKRRAEFLLAQGIITNNVRQDLDWTWDMRNRMHLFLLDESEHDYREYTIANYNRARMAFRSLLEALNNQTI